MAGAHRIHIHTYIRSWQVPKVQVWHLMQAVPMSFYVAKGLRIVMSCSVRSAWVRKCMTQ